MLHHHKYVHFGFPAIHNKSQGGVLAIVNKLQTWTTEKLWFGSWQGQEMHSDRLLGPTQPPFQWLLRVFSLRVNWWGMKLTTHLSHLGFCGALPLLPICLLGVVLNEAKGLYNWIFQCGGYMKFSDESDTSTTTQCGTNTLEEPAASIFIFFHPEMEAGGSSATLVRMY
jgi:hypothetical protein